MKLFLFRALVAVFAICILNLHCDLAVAQAAKTKSADANPWSAMAKLPNFTEGVWGTGGPGAGTLGQQIAGRTMPAFKPGVKRTTVASGENCLPLGMPSVILRPYPFEFVFAPGRITMLLELDGQIRRIYTDGRKHPDDPDPTYAGHSIGHWEKDTLVVDTVGFLPEVQVSPGIPANGSMHIVERMHLTQPDALTIDTTVEAPEVLSQPWSYSVTYQRHRDWEIEEYFCVQNPRLEKTDSK